MAILAGEESLRVPLCDQQWVTRIDERIVGWWIPVVGFVSDATLAESYRKVVRAVYRLVSR